VFFAIGESPGPNALIGGGIIISAVTMASIISSRRREEVAGPDRGL
jgi:hypothetical protein